MFGWPLVVVAGLLVALVGARVPAGAWRSRRGIPLGAGGCWFGQGASFALAFSAGLTTGQAVPLWQTDPRDWQRVLAVNLLGVVPRDPGVRGASGERWRRARAEYRLGGRIGDNAVRGAYGASKPAVVAISETVHRGLGVMRWPIGWPWPVRPSGERMFLILRRLSNGIDGSRRPNTGCLALIDGYLRWVPEVASRC